MERHYTMHTDIRYINLRCGEEILNIRCHASRGKGYRLNTLGIFILEVSLVRQRLISCYDQRTNKLTVIGIRCMQAPHFTVPPSDMMPSVLNPHDEANINVYLSWVDCLGILWVPPED